MNRIAFIDWIVSIIKILMNKNMNEKQFVQRYVIKCGATATVPQAVEFAKHLYSQIEQEYYKPTSDSGVKE